MVSPHPRTRTAAAFGVAFVLSLLLRPSSRAQDRPASAAHESAKARPQEPPRSHEVPAPEVVNKQVLPKHPADPLDGPPFVTARVWAVADGRSGTVLWGHREAVAVDIASTTKIMTALVVVRQMNQDPRVRSELVTFSKRADRTEGSSSDVREGERLPVHELLYGMMLPLGNDAAVAFAEHFGGRLKPPADAPDQRQ
jgi:D-alanyl-D-alanine carboxypeptidase